LLCLESPESIWQVSPVMFTALVHPCTRGISTSLYVIQRGNDRQPCFYSEEDYQFYLDCLYDACKRYHVNLHAYVLMTNHVHLLMTPETSDGVSRVMQSIGRRYVQYVNVTYKHSGTL